MTNLDPPKSLAVLLVEDEAFIRMMVTEMVEGLGHRVVAEAGSIEEAKALALSSAFDFAILDINVGGYDIWPIAEIVERRGLPFLFASGYTTTELPPRFRDRPVLQKPFLVDRLDETINAAVGPG